MRQYRYDSNYKYIGFIDSEEYVLNSTPIEPASRDHTIFDPVNNVWTIPPAITLTLDDIKANKINEARQYFNEIIVNLESNSAEFEVATWETQRSEWLAYISDVNANTPYCDTLATARGITKDVLMCKIGAKITGIAQIQGTLHKTEDSINACTTESEVNAITW